MALVDITPIMTSDTTPPPYVASASSYYGNNNPYKAFVGSMWHSYGGSNQYPQWIKLDFGKKQKLDAYAIKMNTNVLTTVAPKTFKLFGSLDDIVYDEIDSRQTESGWSIGENRIYYLTKQYEYRYYKIEVYSDNGYGYSIFGVGFYEEKEISYITHKNANLTYTLPMATTAQIKAKTNDSRAGLLGMANDPDNFGDLYVVGRDGKAHLTKSGIKSEVIFSGSANSGAITISKNLNEFKYIVVEADNGTLVTHPIVYVETMYETSNTKTLLTKTTDTSLTINQGFNMTIKKVIGIY